MNWLVKLYDNLGRVLYSKIIKRKSELYAREYIRNQAESYPPAVYFQVIEVPENIPDINDITHGYYYVSLNKLTGSAIADIEGTISTEFGDAYFSIARIIFADGTSVRVGGEHEIAYIEHERDSSLNLDEDTMYFLHEQEKEVFLNDKPRNLESL